MSDEPEDPYVQQLVELCTDAEGTELRQYLSEWEAGTYTSAAHSVFNHAIRKGFDPLQYLRKAHNFNRKGAVRVPKVGYREDGSAVYRKGSEFLIVRPDSYGIEKVVTYGIN